MAGPLPGGVLIVLTVAQVASPVLLNLWSEYLFDALEQRALGRFLLLASALGIIILANMESILFTCLSSAGYSWDGGRG